MIHFFNVSQLFHIQWRQHPAVVIASLIINAYTRRSVLTAQKFKCRSDHCGRRVIAIHEHVKTDTCALYPHHRHICACRKTLIIHKSLFYRSQTFNFVECDPGPHKTTKNSSLLLFVERKCASGDGINDFSAFHSKLTFHTLNFNIH